MVLQGVGGEGGGGGGRGMGMGREKNSVWNTHFMARRSFNLAGDIKNEYNIQTPWDSIVTSSL